jgi:hypothetical protein
MGEQLIAACEQGSPMCTPKTVAELLSLDYCPGECSGPSSALSKVSTTTWVIGAAALVAVAVVWKNAREK